MLLVLAAWPLSAAGPPPVFPGRDWQHLPPAQAGLDADALRPFSATAAGLGCVVRHGYLVHAWADETRRGDVA